MRVEETTTSAAVGGGAIPNVLGFSSARFNMEWLEDPDQHEKEFRAWAQAVGIPGGSVTDILDLIRQVYGGKHE